MGLVSGVRRGELVGLAVSVLSGAILGAGLISGSFRSVGLWLGLSLLYVGSPQIVQILVSLFMRRRSVHIVIRAGVAFLIWSSVGWFVSYALPISLPDERTQTAGLYLITGLPLILVVRLIGLSIAVFLRNYYRETGPP